jgi:Acyl-CoA carboxylase epsilon subunit
VGDPGSRETLLRVERGRLDDEELAALTAVLLAVRARPAPPGGHRGPRGSHWFRAPHNYRAPRSWQ